MRQSIRNQGTQSPEIPLLIYFRVPLMETSRTSTLSPSLTSASTSPLDQLRIRANPVTQPNGRRFEAALVHGAYGIDDLF